MEKPPAVIRPEKVQTVNELVDQLNRANIAVLTDYRGLTVAQISALRRQLRPANVEFRVAKNTLVRLAAEQSGREVMLPALTGPTAIAFGFGDPIDLAKALNDSIRTQRLGLTVKNVLLGDQLLPGGDVARLADLPTRDVLIAQVVGTIQGPIAGVVNVLSATLSSIVGVLDARRRQLEESAT
jgi:large subunit ribosomal protein L10